MSGTQKQEAKAKHEGKNWQRATEKKIKAFVSFLKTLVNL